MKKIDEDRFLDYLQLQALIEVQIDFVTDKLREYIDFKGLLFNGDEEEFYADEVFILETREFPTEDNHFISSNRHQLLAVTFRDNSEMESRRGNTYNVRGQREIGTALYSYSEFIEKIDQLGIPLIKPITEMPQKRLNYSVDLINQKSNFTLEEASLIASNTSLEDQRGSDHYSKTTKHYLDILCECVKGQNQNNFHLMTKELWLEYSSEYSQSNLAKYENGVTLNVGDGVSIGYTIISKSELLRWCEFMAIDTGLTLDPTIVEESPEQLKITIHNLEKQLNNLDNELAEFQLEGMFSTSKSSGSAERKEPESKLALLEENTFPVMTKKLEAMLKAQKEYWVDYDPTNLTPQKNISMSICETLGIDPIKGSRKVDELTRAIQPDEIKRK